MRTPLSGPRLESPRPVADRMDAAEPIIVTLPDQDQCQCGGPVYDWVLNLHSLRPPAPSERRLILDELERHGYRTAYNSPRHPNALSIEIAHEACHVTPHQVAAALRLGMQLALPRTPTHLVQYVRFPHPGGPGRFDTLYDGPARDLLGTLEHP